MNVRALRSYKKSRGWSLEGYEAHLLFRIASNVFMLVSKRLHAIGKNVIFVDFRKYILQNRPLGGDSMVMNAASHISCS